MTTKRQYRVDFRYVKSGRKAFTFATATSPEDAAQQVKRHHTHPAIAITEVKPTDRP